MLSIKFIRENQDLIKKAIADKGLDFDLEELIEADKKRKEFLRKIEELYSLKNDINDLMEEAKTDEEKKEILAKAKEIKDKLVKIESQYKTVQNVFNSLMARVPNIPSSDTPVGKGDEDNKEVSRWGKVPSFEFPPQNHIRLGKTLDVLDIKRGVKVAGYRGYFLKNEGASMVMALMMYAFCKMIEKGYTPLIPPTLVREFALFGSGYFKGTRYDPEVDEIYQIATADRKSDGSKECEKKFLVGTAEPSLLAYYSGEILKEKSLPIRFCGFSQCYRSEIGSYGRDTKGIFRVHEFMKVEQVVLAPADKRQADELQNEMLEISKKMYEEMNIPHRVVQVCTGVMGAGKYKMFDIEVWIPSRNAYCEAGSSSNFLDWQSRRLNVKYQKQGGGKEFVYLLNNTALASVRPFIAILENFQQADGSVVIPKVLRKFMPGEIGIIRPK